MITNKRIEVVMRMTRLYSVDRNNVQIDYKGDDRNKKSYYSISLVADQCIKVISVDGSYVGEVVASDGMKEILKRIYLLDILIHNENGRYHCHDNK